MPKVNRKPPDTNKTVVQSYIFFGWNESKAKLWLSNHGLYTGGIEKTSTSIRARQYDPEYFDENRFRIINIKGEDGIKAVIGVPK